MVRGERTVDELRELAARTGDERGAQRLAFTDCWATARAYLADLLAGLPVETETDEAGNFWATLPGERDDAVVIGGHLDSVADGGWLDGSLNVLAGLEVMRGLAADGRPPVTVRLVDWADEEGVRFGGVSMFGSGVATGAVDAAELIELRDRAGITLGQAAGAFGIDLTEAARAGRQLDAMRAYLELHIEQGPVLEGLDLPLAAVSGTAGIERYLIRFQGQRAHAGSTPMRARSDAMLGAARLTVAVRDLAQELGGFGTVGTVRAHPDLPTVVPGRCDVTVDLRHHEQPTLDLMLERCRAVSAEIAAQEKLELEWVGVLQAAATPFDPVLVEIAAAAVRRVSGTRHSMVSGALHDASRIAHAGIPTAMLFVQSLRGLSHCKEEDTDPAHIVLSVEALDQAVRSAIEVVARA